MTTRGKEREVFVINDFIDEADESRIYNQLSESRWRFGWPVPSPHRRPCWHIFIAGSDRHLGTNCEAELESSKQWSFLLNIWRRASNQWFADHELMGVYANGQTFGQDTNIHRDVGEDKAGHTLILFCNAYWPAAWGGELLLYAENHSEVIATVLPLARRAAVFDGRIPHAARSPSACCDQLRITLAFKSISWS